MPTFAVIGATGQVGGVILDQLVKDDSVQIRCLVRSSKKLFKQKPHLEGHKRITITEGSVTNPEAVIDCIKPCSAVFSCTAPAGNIPGCTTAVDTAHSIVAALIKIRLGDNPTPLPKILMLTSSTVNEHLSRETPAFVHWVVHTGLKHMYDDLERAEAYYRLHQSWMTVIFLNPGGLVRQEAVGHVISTEKEYTFLPLPDLANGSIELAHKDGADYDWQNVSFLAKGKTNFEPDAAKNILIGLWWTAMPWLFFLLQWLGFF